MSRNIIETVMGAVVLGVAGVFIVFAYTQASLGTVDGYEVRAVFDRVTGINVGTDVRISGIRVGSVTGLTLDPDVFTAEVRMTIDPRYELTTDTQAMVATESLLGGQFIALQPGPGLDEMMLGPGDTIYRTQSGVSIDDIVGQLIYGSGSTGASSGQADGL